MADTHAAVLLDPPLTPPKAPETVKQILQEDWKKILLSSLAVVVVFGGVSIESRLHPKSPLAAIIAGVPTGLLSTLLISSATVPIFMAAYARSTAVLLVSALIFSVALSSFAQVRQHPHASVILAILFWAGANYVVNYKLG